MLRSMKDLRGYVLLARDGEIGRCHDFLFDDRDLAVRYVVADTGKWLPGKKVLLSPAVLGRADPGDRRMRVDLMREQIESSPDLEEHAPVSRRHENRLAEHYGWPLYWVPAGTVGPVFLPEARGLEDHPDDRPGGEDDESTHLRSTREITGYAIEAADGDLGHLDDLIADVDAWVLRYLVVDTRNWLSGKKVLVSPHWLGSIDWASRALRVRLAGETIAGAPAYDPSAPVNDEQEEHLYDYYGRPVSEDESAGALAKGAHPHGRI